MSLKTIRIDVISDFVCAWCYVGHIELEQGMALAKERGLPVDFAVRYHPLFINQSLSDEAPIPKADYFERKWPNKAEEGHQLLRLLVERGREEGLAFSFGGNVRQTTRAHRLTQKAYNIGGERAQCAILRRLFRAHCEQEKDIGDAHTLALIASSPTHPFSNPAKPFLLGADELINGASTEANTLVNSVGTSDADDDDAAQIFDTEEEALEWIEGHELEAEVKSMSLNAEAKGVKGVPFTVIDGRWAVSGCQKPECYYKIFEKIISCEMCLPPKSEGLKHICPTSTGSQCHVSTSTGAAPFVATVGN